MKVHDSFNKNTEIESCTENKWSMKIWMQVEYVNKIHSIKYALLLHNEKTSCIMLDGVDDGVK